MIRTVIWVVYFFAYLFFAQPMLWKVRKLRKEGKIEEHDRIVRTMVNNWALRLMKLAGATMEVTGKENIPEGPVVFAANHQGYADIPLLLTQLDKPNPLIAKKELEKVPLLRDWMTELNCIFIDRDNARQAMDSLKKANELLSEGYSVCIFPEGTRSKGGEIKDFKGGTIRLATRAKVPIVPCCIEGTYNMLEANKGFKITPAKLQLHILPAIETADLSREEIKALDERLRSVIKEKRDSLMK
ncbi:MAG: 1-acyl-sn-glycerol-3-phosphate acyltransferase [Ruminococcaceae bacterium]|nr:1-acyl-sn-glycerol-3-phosphate acyltransferase [Oscillospiraceae bacterium]